MKTLTSVGVYVCHCGTNIAGVVDVKALREHASKLGGVSVARDFPYMCSEAGQELIAKDVKSGVDRVVVAACSPAMHERTFRGVLEKAGLNAYLLEVVNIREQCSWVHGEAPAEATEKAKKLLAMGVARARLLEPLQPMAAPVAKRVLVVGGGIAGITASLNAANMGYEVLLVEKEGSIGGRMAQLEKTFPTLDCSPCILTPLMAEAASNEKIKLFTNSEVRSVEGVAGNFEVKIHVKPRYVDPAKCIGCGACSRFCPAEAPSAFNEGLSTRKAIYVEFPQAVPRVPVIDPSICLHFKDPRSCDACFRKCPTKAVDFSQKEAEFEAKVGAIIVATGFGLYENLGEYGLGRSRSVVTGMQFERLACPSGPTGGKIARPGDEKEPKTIAIVLCAGSRDERHLESCCAIGCMAGLKHAWYVKSHAPDAEVYVLYNDLRASGKGYEEFYGRLREMGVIFVKGKPSHAEVLGDGAVALSVYDQTLDEFVDIRADLVVLETGLVPSEGSEKVREALKIPKGKDGFLLELHPKLHPVETHTEGIYLAGAAQGPKDIPSAVAQALAASGKAAERVLSKDAIAVEPVVAEVRAERCSKCAICLPVCPFGALRIAEVGGKEQVVVEEAKCKGCGACVAACPSSALDLRHYRERQIVEPIREAAI